MVEEEEEEAEGEYSSLRRHLRGMSRVTYSGLLLLTLATLGTFICRNWSVVRILGWTRWRLWWRMGWWWWWRWWRGWWWRW